MQIWVGKDLRNHLTTADMLFRFSWDQCGKRMYELKDKVRDRDRVKLPWNPSSSGKIRYKGVHPTLLISLVPFSPQKLQGDFCNPHFYPASWLTILLKVENVCLLHSHCWKEIRNRLLWNPEFLRQEKQSMVWLYKSSQITGQHSKIPNSHFEAESHGDFFP